MRVFKTKVFNRWAKREGLAVLLGMCDPRIAEARKRSELVKIDCGKQETT